MHPRSMVERAARALSAAQGTDPEQWREQVPIVETVLAATILPELRSLMPGENAEAYEAAAEWRTYRESYGSAGAWAREPKLLKLTGWPVQAAWRTWNGMVVAALQDSRSFAAEPEAGVDSPPRQKVRS